MDVFGALGAPRPTIGYATAIPHGPDIRSGYFHLHGEGFIYEEREEDVREMVVGGLGIAPGRSMMMMMIMMVMVMVKHH